MELLCGQIIRNIFSTSDDEKRGEAEFGIIMTDEYIDRKDHTAVSLLFKMFGNLTRNLENQCLKIFSGMGLSL